MGWETRKGSQRRFYYRKVREGGRVRSVYCGAGEAGERAAREDAERRGATPARSQPPTPITRAEIIRHAEGNHTGYGRAFRRRAVLIDLGRGRLSMALRAAGIEEAEVARRGLSVGPSEMGALVLASRSKTSRRFRVQDAGDEDGR